MVLDPAERGSTGRSSQFTDQARYGFAVGDALTTTGNDIINVLPGQGDVVSQASGNVRVAPVGAAITVDIQLINLTTGAVVSTLATLTIAAAALVGSIDFTPTLIDSAHGLVIAITQIGSISAGSTLTVVVT